MAPDNVVVDVDVVVDGDGDGDGDGDVGIVAPTPCPITASDFFFGFGAAAAAAHFSGSARNFAAHPLLQKYQVFPPHSTTSAARSGSTVIPQMGSI